MRITRLAFVLPLLLLAGCFYQPEPTASLPSPPAMPAVVHGIDVASAAGPLAQTIKNSGIGFIARYYRKAASRWPTLTGEEARQLSSTGLNLVAVWESHSRARSYFSFASGYADGANAYAQAAAVGQPAGSAIYFAIDYDAKPADIGGAVAQYFRGIASGFAAASGGRPQYRVGVYGSGAVCAAMKQTGLVQYAWLSVSPNWSGSRNYGGWDIRQGKALPGLPFNHDSDEARSEYGSFQLAVPG